MARFQIYNASAGAGKTYSLVLNFLKICLADDNPGHFRRILAITFTNKAANEMKARILEALQSLAEYESGDEVAGMLEDLCSLLEVTPERLSYRARQALKTILHQYSAFSVSTIDRFTNRLIRSFARDLQLNTNYDVELDNQAMLTEAIDQLLDGLSEDSLTTRVVLRFINSSLEEGQSPRPEKRLAEMGRNLFSEEAFPHLKKLRNVPAEVILQAGRELREEKDTIESNLQKEAQNLLTLLHDHGVEPLHFSRGTVYNYIKKLAEGNLNDWKPNTTVDKALESGIFYAASKKTADEAAALFAPVVDRLLMGLESIKGMYNELHPRHQLICLLLKDIYALSVLAEIDQQLQLLKENSNRLPIGEFNKLISDKLEHEPADYLFEKLGERYQHFFVDEFQDTSRLQWKNLLPLINNALAGSGSAMIVGDGKQSIYRFRGGEVKQFIDLSNNTDSSNKIVAGEQEIELYSRKTVLLPSNYRSRKNIVEFNNEFFQGCAPLLVHDDHEQMYIEGNRQEVKRGEGGYVHMELIDGNKQEYAEAQCHKCLSIIEDALERGFELQDIAILVRGKSRGALLAEFLLQNNIPVISPDSLSLQESREVRGLVSFLTFMIRPDDHRARYDFLEMIFDRKGGEAAIGEKHEFMAGLLKIPAAEVHQRIKDLLPGYDAGEIMLLPLLDKVYYLARTFSLSMGTDPFLHAFVDVVDNFQQTRGEDLAAFVRWWEQLGCNGSLALPEGTNAVQIMTIHKSKGLQFKITILAFADWRATFEHNSRGWISLPAEETYGLPAAWVGLKKPDEGSPDDQYFSLCKENSASIHLDNLNLLYVAMTRAVEELYVLSGKQLWQPATRVHRYLAHYLQQKNADDLLIIGEKFRYKKSDTKQTASTQPIYEQAEWRSKVRIAVTAPLYWQGNDTQADYGKKVHGILAELNTGHKVKNILKQQQEAGMVQGTETDDLLSMAEEVVNHPELREFFSNDVAVFNEREILIPKKGIARPDRVVVNGSDIHIIDYKTGKREMRHRQQVDEYRELLTAMGYQQGKNILVYIGDTLEVEQW